MRAPAPLSAKISRVTRLSCCRSVEKSASCRRLARDREHADLVPGGQGIEERGQPLSKGVLGVRIRHGVAVVHHERDLERVGIDLGRQHLDLGLADADGEIRGGPDR